MGRVSTGARRAFAAAHVVADAAESSRSESLASIDFEATMVFRRHLASLGLGIAEAMDTAQRGMGVNWSTARELITATLDEVGDHAAVACGVATDQLDVPAGGELDVLADAYREQLEFVEARGGIAVVMCSRHLAAAARTAEDYLSVYRRVLKAAERPVILHWLGETFDPELAGYWSPHSLDEATQVVLELCSTGRVDGVKVSLLDAAFEVKLRRQLPDGVRLYTGDDFNYVDLIAGDDDGYSDALLGVFDPLAAVAAEALRALGNGDEARYRAMLEPTVPLARLIFEAPTQFYKTGVVWLAYLGGFQSHFRMVGGAESGRSARHLLRLWSMADHLDLFADPELARSRAKSYALSLGLPLSDGP
ncbi:DUF993 family protein [Candidatus Poriferisodalis sp.]|uniref:DUF993 family protein n=1 Tax=Candidatus Poriferisodalis sp. TaxID=3101277 RepID=UPI003B01B862